MTTADGTLAVSHERANDREERPTGGELVVVTLARRWRWLLPAGLMLTAGLAWRGAPAEQWPMLAYVTAACVTLAAVDAHHHRLPDVLTLGSYPVVAALLLIPATTGDQFQAWTRACFACLAVAFGFAVLGGALGYGTGDAKLAGLVAMPLAWHSWGLCLAGLWAGVLMASMSGVGLFIMRRIGRRDRFAAGPGLMAGAYLVLLVAL